MIISVKTLAATHDLQHKKNVVHKVQNVNWMLHKDEITFYRTNLQLYYMGCE